jgi:SAM-dependent methyltransferase
MPQHIVQAVNRRPRELARRLGALHLVRPLNAAIRRLAHITHRWQMDMEWGVAPVPEWYDTFLGQYYRWREDSVSWIWDRGVYSVLAMAPGARVLELCCGSGFFTRYFYSGRAAQVIAVDFDPRAITHARKYNAADNIRYEVADIRRSLPQGIYDNVVWDAAIEHFTEQEITEVLAQITRRLTPGGTFSGYTLQEREGLLQHPDHEYEFKSKSDLGELLLRLFRNVLVFETIYPERHNLHFIASDGPLPFDPAWPQALRLTRD